MPEQSLDAHQDCSADPYSTESDDGFTWHWDDAGFEGDWTEPHLFVPVTCSECNETFAYELIPASLGEADDPDDSIPLGRWA